MDIEIPTLDDFAQVKTGEVVIDIEKCTGCGVCAQICPGDVLEMVGEGKKKKASVRAGGKPSCMACNCCQAACPADAIKAVCYYDFGAYYRQMDRGEMTPPRKF
jgi:formate hydrogenlyase subunit 6/NADH:ubiquinone oxidoreductase subunit I